VRPTIASSASAQIERSTDHGFSAMDGAPDPAGRPGTAGVTAERSVSLTARGDSEILLLDVVEHEDRGL
jgi:hypothetical protein